MLKGFMFFHKFNMQTSVTSLDVNKTSNFYCFEYHADKLKLFVSAYLPCVRRKFVPKVRRVKQA